MYNLFHIKAVSMQISLLLAVRSFELWICNFFSNINILIYQGTESVHRNLNSICTFLFCKNTDIIFLSLRYYILIFPYYLLRARDWCEAIRSKQVFERLFYVTYTLFAWLVLQKLNGQRQTLDYIFRTIKHPSFVLFGLSISYS